MNSIVLFFLSFIIGWCLFYICIFVIYPLIKYFISEREKQKKKREDAIKQKEKQRIVEVSAKRDLLLKKNFAFYTSERYPASFKRSIQNPEAIK